MAPTVVIALASVLLGSAAIVGATGLRRGPLISPFSTSMFVLVSIFGIRPIYMVALGQYDFYGYNVEAGVFGAALVGLLAIAGLALGYAIPAVRPTSSDQSETTVPTEAGTTVSFAAAVWVALVFVATWFALISLIGGGPEFVSEVFRGRTARIRDLTAGVPVLVGAISTAATGVLAAGRIATERGRPLVRREHLWYWAVGAATVIPPTALGTRRFLLPTLIVLMIAPLVRTWNRRVNGRVVFGALVLFLVLVTVPFIRSAGSRSDGAGFATALVEYVAESGWSGATENYFVSYDTEMFNYVAFTSERLGKEIPYGYGAWTVGDAMLAPLPSGMTNGLGLRTRSDSILVSSFGATCAVGRCPVPSAVGVVFTDFGAIGVPITFILIGLGVRVFETRFLKLTGWRLSVGLLFVGFAPVLVRGNTVNTLWVFANVVALTLVGGWMVVRRESTGRYATPFEGRVGVGQG